MVTELKRIKTEFKKIGEVWGEGLINRGWGTRFIKGGAYTNSLLQNGIWDLGVD